MCQVPGVDDDHNITMAVWVRVMYLLSSELKQSKNHRINHKREDISIEIVQVVMRLFVQILLIMILLGFVSTTSNAANTDRSGRRKKRRTKGIVSKAPYLRSSLTYRKENKQSEAKAALKLGFQRSSILKGKKHVHLQFHGICHVAVFLLTSLSHWIQLTYRWPSHSRRQHIPSSHQPSARCVKDLAIYGSW